MPLKFILLIVLAANYCKAVAQDLKVFDLKLNDSFKIPECPCKVQETASKNGISVKKNR